MRPNAMGTMGRRSNAGKIIKMKTRLRHSTGPHTRNVIMP